LVIRVRKKSSAAARRTRSGVRAAWCGPARIVLTGSPPVTRATAVAAKLLFPDAGFVAGSADARMATNAVPVTSVQ
jgi:hypothetical protein